MSAAMVVSGVLAFGAPSIELSVIDGAHVAQVSLEHRPLPGSTRFSLSSDTGTRGSRPGRSSCWTAHLGEHMLVLSRHGDVFDGVRLGPDGVRAVRSEGGSLRVGPRATIPTGLAPCGRRDTALIGPPPREAGRAQGGYRGMASSGCREVRIGIETDWQFTEVFGGDVDAASDYAATLLAAVSAILEQDLHVTVTPVSVRIWGDDSDPYDTAETDMDYLDQFAQEWSKNAPADAEDRHLAHLLSGSDALAWAGYAWVGSTCSSTTGYAYSSSLEGGWWSWNPWDLLVVTHEIGHNLGADHTHEMSPPLDLCGLGDCTDPASTIMSYCHTCPGGYANIALTFHPAVRADIWAHLGQRESWAGCDIAVVPTSDVDGDGAVAWSDVEQVLVDWAACSCCPADVDASGTVGVGDVLRVLEDWTGMPG